MTLDAPGDDDDDDGDAVSGEEGSGSEQDADGDGSADGSAMGSESEEDGGSSSDNDEDVGGDKEGLAEYEAKRRACVAGIKSDLGGLVRSKGFFWVATQHDSMLEWSHAGVLLAVGRLGPWFAALPEVRRVCFFGCHPLICFGRSLFQPHV